LGGDGLSLGLLDGLRDTHWLRGVRPSLGLLRGLNNSQLLGANGA